jgi:hypothetical protein
MIIKKDPYQADQASSRDELRKLMEEMRLSEATKAPEIPATSAQLQQVPLGSSFAQSQNKPIGLGALGEPQSEEMKLSGGQAAVAEGTTKAVAQVAQTLAKAKFLQEQEQRKIEQQKIGNIASGQMQASKLASEGGINPLRSLIANYKAALS